MSKERLEEIKDKWADTKLLFSDDINYLIEQAERVQELEKFKRDVEQMHRYTHLNAKKSVEEKENLQKQNKRYREALEESNEKLMNLYNDMSDHRIDMDEATKRLEFVGANILRKTLEGEE